MTTTTLEMSVTQNGTKPTQELASEIFKDFPDFADVLRNLPPGHRPSEYYFREFRKKGYFDGVKSAPRKSYAQAISDANRKDGKGLFADIIDRHGLNYFAYLGYVAYMGLDLPQRTAGTELTRTEYDFLVDTATSYYKEFLFEHKETLLTEESFNYIQTIFRDLCKHNTRTLMSWGNAMKDSPIDKSTYDNFPTPEEIAFVKELIPFLPPESKSTFTKFKKILTSILPKR